MILTRTTLAAVAVVLSAGAAQATTRQVGPGQTYATIQACEDASAAGDVCNIHAGTYSQTINVNVSSLTFQNQAGESPIVVGRFIVNSTPNVTIKCNNGGGVMQITGFSPSGIEQQSGTGLTVDGCMIHDGIGGGVYSRNSTRLTITNSEMFNLTYGNGQDGTGVIVISGHSSDGTYANGVTISNNLVHDNHVDGLQIHGQFFTISGNIVRDNLYTDWIDTHPDGIQLNAGSADGYSSVQHAVITNNVFKNQTQNIFLEGSVSGQASDCDDILITNNVLYVDSGSVHGVALDSLYVNSLVIKFSKNVRVYNNTFGRSGSNAIFVQDSYNGTITIKNNVFNNTLGTGIYVESTSDVSAGAIDYNIYNNANSDVIWGSARYNSRSAFASGVPGMETHGLDGDPLLNPFPTPTLKSGSPAIGKGLDLSSVCATCALDGLGLVRSGGWDLGAYQAGGGSGSAGPVAPVGLRIVSGG